MIYLIASPVVTSIITMCVCISSITWTAQSSRPPSVMFYYWFDALIDYSWEASELQCQAVICGLQIYTLTCSPPKNNISSKLAKNNDGLAVRLRVSFFLNMSAIAEIPLNTSIFYPKVTQIHFFLWAPVCLPDCGVDWNLVSGARSHWQQFSLKPLIQIIQSKLGGIVSERHISVSATNQTLEMKSSTAND